MGCTSGKTSNPNKNANGNPVQPRSPLHQNPNLPNNQSNMIPNMPVNSNINSTVPNQPYMNSGLPNQPNMNYNMPNQPSMQQSMTTPTKVFGQQNAYQGSAGLVYQGESNFNGINSSIRNSGTPNNLHNSQLHQSGNHLGSPHMNGSVHASGFKPNQIDTHDTTDDEMVNQEKSMNFDLGIKFNMQIEVE